MLENKKFVEWANENIVVVVGHTEKEHPTEIEDDKGDKTPGCPVYPGLTCEEHRAITGECMNPPDDLPKIEVGNQMPNSWLVSPSGEVVAIESSAQRVAGKIEDLVTEMQKEAGKGLAWKKYSKHLESLEATDAALADGNLKEALKELSKVEKAASKMPEGMKAEVDARVDALNAKATEAFTAIKDGEGEVAARIKEANTLKRDVGKRLKRGYLPVVEAITAWLKEAKKKS